MHGYIVKGGNVATVLDDPAVARLLSAGPWQAQPHPLGAMLVWKAEDGIPVPSHGFGPQRDTVDGLVYLPPKKLPLIGTLLGASMRQRDDLHTLRIVREETVTEVRILPAYLSPRKILDSNDVGGFSSRYGKAVRQLLDKLNTTPPPKFSEYSTDMIEACRLAIMFTHPRMTRELVTEYELLDEDTIWDIWRATLIVPKEPSAPASES